MSFLLDKLRAFAAPREKSYQQYVESTVRLSDMSVSSAPDPSSLRLLSMAGGQVMRCAALNADVAKSITPRLFRRKGGGGAGRLTGKRVDHKTLAFLKGHTEYPSHAKAMQALQNDDAMEILEGEEINLLRKPNPMMLGSAFRYQKLYYKQLAGDYWAHVVKDAPGGMAILGMLPQYTSVRMGKDGMPEAILYARDGSSKSGVGVRLNPDECIVWKFRPGRTNPWRGEGWLINALEEAGLLGRALAAQHWSWENMQRPDWLYLLPPTATQPQVDDARKAIDSRHRGIRGVSKPLVGVGVDAKVLTFSPKDSMFDTQIAAMMKAIRNAAGVPEALQDMNSSTFENAAASVTTHRRDTILPMLNTDAEEDTEYLLPLLELDPSVYFVAYTDVVPVNEAAIGAKIAATRMETTVNERRSWLGLSDVEWGDKEPVAPSANPLAGGFGSTDKPNTEEKPKDPPKGDDAKEGEPLAKTFRVTIKHHHELIGCDCHKHEKAAPNPLTERGIQRFANALELWFIHNEGRITVNPNGTVELGDAATELAELLRDPMEGVSDAAITRAQAIPVGDAGRVNPQSINRYLDSYRVNLARQITVREQDALTAAIRDGQANGLSLAETTAQIRDVLPEEAGWRALRIANTETATVEQETDIEVWNQMGVEAKQWILAPDACSVCVAFFAQYASMPVPVAHVYCPAGTTIVGADGRSFTTYRDIRSGPLHPNDRCGIMAAR